MKLNVFNTYISPRASHYLNEVLESGHLSEGLYSKSFEQALMKRFGLRNLLAVNSGTSALHLALDVLNIGPGDEVIIPAQTFIATGLSVLYTGAKPVFADIRYEDGNIDPESIKNKITPRTKAILLVHWGGYPCDLNALKDLVKGTKIKLIEDAAHALGASYQKLIIGNISDITCFSFQAIKHLTTGDGGAICINDDELFEKASSKKWFGINRDKADVSELGERQYNIAEKGYKYHLNNLSSALGLANLEGYDERLTKRQAVASYYRETLKSVHGIRLFEEKEDRKSAYWLFGFHVDHRLEFIKALKDKGIAASVVHQRIDRNSVFGGLNRDLKGQEAFDKTQIHIPIHDAISMKDAAYIVNTIKSGWA
ncbi:MAG TPA: DegT/DnrJ/EryC1/StrS family aminotransferase [Bacteroidia bacterium]|nr:DegT/DnrJ/EryC1/StrS family aminotransferase [Bacteroidia bacterium]